MADIEHARENPRETLFEQLSGVSTGMLVVTDSGHHPQPMTHHADMDEGAIWFIGSRQSDLVRAIGLGAMGEFTITSEHQDFFASLRGPLEQSENDAKLDELWSQVAGAWFEGGREDPDVALLRLSVNEAAIWAATRNMLSFGYEIAKANLQEGHEPDIGFHTVINFADVET